MKQTTLQRSTTLAENIDQYDINDIKEKIMKEKLEEIEKQAEKIREKLESEIEQGLVSVDTDKLRIIIRINENASFPSGSAVLKAGFEPVMTKIAESVNESPGKVHVAGHTDNIPISTQAYRSNWELSASRAVTASHFLFSQTGTDANRFVVEGYADTKPIVPNDSSGNRAKNRRVEIELVQEDPTLSITEDSNGVVNDSEEKAPADLKTE